MQGLEPKWARLFLPMAVLGVVCTVAVQPAYALDCGAEIRTNLKLTADLGPCPATGLLITGAPAGGRPITIDLNGHDIFGMGTGTGLQIMFGSGITVKGPGRIVRFGTGIFIDDAIDVMIYDVFLESNQTGLESLFSSGVRVFDNTISGGDVGQTGVFLGDVFNCFFHRNTVRRYAVMGVTIDLGTYVFVDENVITENKAGVFVKGDGGATLRGNRIFGNTGNGIYAKFSMTGAGLTLEDNEIRNNTGNGIVLDSNIRRAVVQDNLVNNNLLRGISVLGGQDSKILGNRLRGNSTDLFTDGLSTNTCWKQNVFRTSSPATLPQCP